jgi:DNA-binding cell septation regulator SpoVG
MKVLDAEFRSFNKEGNKCVAFATVTIDHLIMSGFSIIDGTNGLFVAWPRQQNKRDKKYYETVYPDDKDLRKELSAQILDKYKIFKGGTDSQDDNIDSELGF